MASNVVEGFLPSRHGFRFVNRWPTGPARVWHLGLLHVGIGDVGRGLCGGMAFVARDRFDRGDDGELGAGTERMEAFEGRFERCRLHLSWRSPTIPSSTTRPCSKR